MTRHRIAIVGSGIAGLSAAWLLSQSHDVSLYEKDDRAGGHANTVEIETRDGPVSVDTGFIVFNERNYPNLIAFLDRLGVATVRSSMSFAVSVAEGRMEYSGKLINGLFGQRRNIVRVRHWQLVSDILRFFREAERQVRDADPDMPMSRFLEQHNYSRTFIEDHILPISAAIWSTPARSMLEFPARTFVAFFANHGLLQINNRPHWRTIPGGSARYVREITARSRFNIETGAPVESVFRHEKSAELRFASGRSEQFDEIIFACHADQALRLLGDASSEERDLLSAFRHTRNRAVLHTDPRFMPRRRHLWSAWNYLRSSAGEGAALSLTYWMNRLQPLPTKTEVFVTLNPQREFARGTVHGSFDYEHPIFDAPALAAQRAMWRIQGGKRTWFAGAWLGYGFHEDGLQSGLEIAERIGPLSRPWNVVSPRGRVAHNWNEGERKLLAAE